MIEYVPATEKVAKAYEIIMHGWHEDGSGYTTEKEALEEFHRWLNKVKAEAWQEGHSASESEWMHTFDGHPVPEGEMCPECSIGNPYRQEKDS